jgi:hypothetical protein
MPCSPEKLASNRKNSLKSTGPSPAGRLISRRNSLKHGLTGAGIVIPDEDLAAVEERIEAFTADLKPRNDVAGFLAVRVAVLSVRMDRCVRQEAAKITGDMTRAEAEEAEERAGELAFFTALIEKEPAEAVRNLERSGEGIDWLIRSWRGMLTDLLDVNSPRFLAEKAQRLSGRKPEAARDPRLTALAQAILGNFRCLRGDDWPDLPDLERREAVRGELRVFIEGQIARLEEVRAALDHEAIARDRAGAEARAIFDPSKEATLARKYEAAAERGFFKALKEIERINAQVESAEEVAANIESVEDCGDLASFLPDEEGEVPRTPREPWPTPVSCEVDLQSRKSRVGAAEARGPIRKN